MFSSCITCKGLQRDPRDSKGHESPTQVKAVQLVNTTLPSLRMSSGSCRACALLLQGILLHHDRFAGIQDKDIKVVAEYFQSTSVKAAQDHLSVELRWKDTNDGCCGDSEQDGDGYPNLKFEFFTDQEGQSSYSAIGKGRHITDAYLQESGLQASRSLIGQCLANHSRCRHVKPHVKPATLPRRVLDVMIDDPSKPVKLHESAYDEEEGHYEYGEYLALSYVLGTGQNIPQTSTKTLKAHKKGIAWASLPRTFQEAVLLTRSRGFRWLWIDCLCILQDDPAEKISEALKMDEVFGNAFVTIAATAGANPTRGLFPSRRNLFKIQARDSKGSISKICVREQPSHYTFKAPFNEAHMNDWTLPFLSSKEDNINTPLMQRAWPYVERLLSPRVLHFTESEMILECRESYQCECGRINDSAYDSRTTDSVKQEFARIAADSLSQDIATNGNDGRIDSLTSQLADSSLAEFRQTLSKKRTEALQLWGYIVTEYTSKNLTYNADRLVGIAAVAKTLAKPLDSGYVAGHWTCSTLGLLWYPMESTHCRRTKQMPEIRVPSWSWASLEGSPILFDNTSAMDLACEATFPSKDTQDSTWSPVCGENIVLTASMATEVAFHKSNAEYSLVRNGVSVEFRPDIIPPCDDDAMDSGEKLTVVLVSMTFRSSIVGLVLKCSGANPQIYRRVGRFECYECHRDNGQAEPEDAESLFGYWFPEVEDMTQLDEKPRHSFVVV